MTAAETLNFVFACAISDRQSLAEGCHKDDPMRADTMADIKRFRALRDKLLKKRTPANMVEWLESQSRSFDTVQPMTTEGKCRLLDLEENDQVVATPPKPQ